MDESEFVKKYGISFLQQASIYNKSSGKARVLLTGWSHGCLKRSNKVSMFNMDKIQKKVDNMSVD